ncbi:MAG: penicillin-binding protein [Bacteroidetes bacterium]|nr:penicillin-binding protein [Bacteroidota bacterium]
MALKGKIVPKSNEEVKKWIVRFVVWSSSGLIIFLSLIYLGIFGPIPDYEELRSIKQANATELISIDGKVLGRYFIENRVDVQFSEIPPFLIHALLATEDTRFFEHKGIDIRALFRVFFKSILLMDESSGGGSTLSQQLAKNLFPRKSYWLASMPVNKFREMITAQRLEKIYSKEELLNLYLNTVPFGGSIYGINVASQTFYGKKPTKLNIAEAALLIGMLKGPSLYNPVNHPERALNRRNTVLSQMVKYDYLTETDFQRLSSTSLNLRYNPQGRNTGLAAYFREYIRPELEKIVGGIKKPDGNYYNLFTDGLRIFTTLDYYLQLFSEQAVKEQMPQIQANFFREWRNGKPWRSDAFLWNIAKQSDRYKQLENAGATQTEIEENFNRPIPMQMFAWNNSLSVERIISPLDSIKISLQILQAALLSLDPKSGAVRAWIGGNHFGYNQFDHVNANRQVGSIFKPIVYAAAIQEGLNPCTYYPNEQFSYPDYEDWKPENADNIYGGFYSMGGALSKSINTIAVQVLFATGIDEVREMGRALGITSNIPKAPSIALGSAELSLYEMTNVYATLVNKGIKSIPHYLLRIETKEGKVIYSAPQQKRVQAIDPYTSETLLPMLKSTVNSGTGSRLRSTFGLKMALAGKTGTTQNNSDGWFIGASPNLVTGVWVGASLPAIHFRTTASGQGAATALPIFGSYYHRLAQSPGLRKYIQGDFYQETDSTSSDVNCAPYLETGGFSAETDPDIVNNPAIFRAVYQAILKENGEFNFSNEIEYPIELSRKFLFESDSAYLRRMFNKNLKILKTEKIEEF